MKKLPLKPIFYYSVLSNNIGDRAIRKSIVDSIKSNINVPISFFNTQYDELTEERIIKQINKEASVLMIAGGGLYVNRNSSSGWYFPCNTKLFDKIKVPIILCGLGCNNHIKDDIYKGELSEKAKLSIKKINKLATMSSVRDIRTNVILRELDLKKQIVMLDPACFLNINKSINKEKRVAINIAQHSPSLGRYDGSQELRDKNLNNFAEICVYLKLKGYKVIFIAFDPLEQSLILDLKKLVPDLEYLNTQNIDTILEEYARCEFSIGVKMHSNILSYAVGTPFISLYYDYKSIEFIKLLKYSYFSKPIFSNYLLKLFPIIDVMIKNHKLLSTQIIINRNEYQKLFNSQINKICNIIIQQSSGKEINSNITKEKITVLMPVYNRENLIKESIESILNQTYRNLEFLIYDDGSTDNTVKIIEDYRKKDNRIRLIKGKYNKGGLYAKQMLLDACKTKIACWQDSDDTSDPYRLEIQLPFINKYDLVFTNWQWNRYNKTLKKWKLQHNTANSICYDSLMFIVDKKFKMDVTKVWGSSIWFQNMINTYPHIKLNQSLYYIKDHEDRVSIIKRKIEKKIKNGVLKKEDIKNLNYAELRKLARENE